ncbi:MAG: hypothetical protein J1F16_05430 [Muribaculaceae bacterium]|nr:hypothetical protein [Muribaculaceae bacterium]
MRFKKIYGYAAATLILGGMFSSCDNSLKDPTLNPNDNLQVTKASDVVAYSGDKVLGSTFGTNTMNLSALYATRSANEYPEFFTFCTTGHTGSNDWQYAWTPNGTFDLSAFYDKLPKATGRGQDGRATSQSEADYVFNWINDNSDKGYTEATTPDIYFFQCVGANNLKYNWNGNGEENYTMDNLWLNEDYNNPYNQGDHSYGNSYTGNCTGPKVQGELVLCANYPIINPSYTHTNGGRVYNAYKFFYITLPEDVNSEDAGKTCLYLGFDFRTPDVTEPSRQPEPFLGNGKYYDWVMKIIPADGSIITAPTPETSDEDEDDPIVTPPSETPEHVEVNFAVEDHKDWLATHLSIHVRANTNVEIFIPIDAQYVCEPDDLAIVNKHLEDKMLHGGPESMTYNVGGKTVTLNIEHRFGENYVPEGLRIWTEGIDQDVIDYCREEYGDGITFEVWNYFNSELIDRDSLRKELLTNNSTIKFIENCPDLYVNAFFDGFENQYEYDCPVLIKEQADEYNDGEKGLWYNGSDTNYLYWNKNYSKENK